MKNNFIFNQYYIDLIKKLKSISKKHKDKSKTAKKIINSIKQNYLTLDKTTDEYVNFFCNNFTDEIYDKFINTSESKELKKEFEKCNDNEVCCEKDTETEKETEKESETEKECRS